VSSEDHLIHHLLFHGLCSNFFEAIIGVKCPDNSDYIHIHDFSVLFPFLCHKTSSTRVCGSNIVLNVNCSCIVALRL
jgi:hypothetical protein